jgi:hypothetical protein
VRENRTHGSEGGEGTALPDPYRITLMLGHPMSLAGVLKKARCE